MRTVRTSRERNPYGYPGDYRSGCGGGEDAPEKLGDLAADPKAAIEGIIGEGNLGDVDPAQILSGLQEKVSGLDLGALAENLPEQLKGLAHGVDVSGIAVQVGGILGGLFNNK